MDFGFRFKALVSCERCEDGRQNDFSLFFLVSQIGVTSLLVQKMAEATISRLVSSGSAIVIMGYKKLVQQLLFHFGLPLGEGRSGWFRRGPSIDFED